MKKRAYIIFALMAFLASPNISARDLITIAAFDFLPLQGMMFDESEMASEIIRSEIIRSEFIRVIETEQLSKIESEVKFQETGLSSGADIEAGKRLKADYFLMGTMSSVNGRIIITARIASSATGENIYAGIIDTSRENIICDLKIISVKICSQVLAAALGNTVDNIQRLLDRSEYEEAERKLEIFIRNFGESGRTGEIRERITTGLADLCRKRYNEALKKGDIKSAYKLAGTIMKLRPGDSGTISLYSSAMKIYDRHMKDEYRMRMKACREMITDWRFDDARKILDRYFLEDGSHHIDEEYYRHYEAIEKKIVEKLYRDALSLSRVPVFIGLKSIGERDFISFSGTLEEARMKAIYSIEKDPENAGYVSLLNTIHENNSAVYSAYSRSIEVRSPGEYMKKLDWMFSIAPLIMSNLAKDRSPLAQKSVYLGLEGNCSYRMMLQDDRHLMAILGAWYITGSDNWGGERSGYRTSYAIFNLSLGMLFGYAVPPFSIQAGPVAQIGWIYRTLDS